jgi:hypothetical protein
MCCNRALPMLRRHSRNFGMGAYHDPRIANRDRTIAGLLLVTTLQRRRDTAKCAHDFDVRFARGNPFA